jgi:hypothetical protein
LGGLAPIIQEDFRVGVLTDLILATEEELAALDPDELPIQVLPGLDVKGTGLIELATLHSIITGKPFDPGLEAFPAVSDDNGEDGPWVFRCSPELIAGLAAADHDELARVAEEWAKTDEIQQARWEADELEQRLREMQEFARRAETAGKPVHIWTSL